MVAPPPIPRRRGSHTHPRASRKEPPPRGVTPSKYHGRKVFDPLAALSADRPLAQWCRGGHAAPVLLGQGRHRPPGPGTRHPGVPGWPPGDPQRLRRARRNGPGVPELGLRRPGPARRGTGRRNRPRRSPRHPGNRRRRRDPRLPRVGAPAVPASRRGSRLLRLARGASLARAFNVLARALGQADPRERHLVRGEYLPAEPTGHVPAQPRRALGRVAHAPVEPVPASDRGPARVIFDLLPATQFERPCCVIWKLEMGRVVESAWMTSRRSSLIPWCAMRSHAIATPHAPLWVCTSRAWLLPVARDCNWRCWVEGFDPDQYRACDARVARFGRCGVLAADRPRHVPRPPVRSRALTHRPPRVRATSPTSRPQAWRDWASACVSPLRLDV